MKKAHIHHQAPAPIQGDPSHKTPASKLPDGSRGRGIIASPSRLLALYLASEGRGGFTPPFPGKAFSSSCPLTCGPLCLRSHLVQLGQKQGSSVSSSHCWQRSWLGASRHEQPAQHSPGETRANRLTSEMLGLEFLPLSSVQAAHCKRL